MANLKSLAKDTAIYGLSSIVGRFLNYLLVPLYTHVISAANGGYGIVTNLYGYVALLLVILVFGMETTFFRFANNENERPNEVFSNAMLIIGTLVGIFLAIIFGGIHRIATVSSWLVPIMAVGYIILALGVVVYNITEIPSVLAHIFRSAFGWEQAIGGGMGAAVMQGIKRGLFSNEAGMGSAPNVAATATTSHPVKQGFIQALGVFTDTLVICTCTAFIILVSNPSPDASLNGIQLTQAAFTTQVGNLGSVFVAIAILLFAFSSIIGNYYYGESNIRFISRRPIYLWIYRILVGGMVMCGAMMSLDLAWSFADVTMGLMTICNLIAIVLLSRQVLWLLHDYTTKKRKGIGSPTFHKSEMPESMRHDVECWDEC